MAKKTVPDLKELFKQAAEIAQQVPESMQEAAFNRALEMLTGSSRDGSDIQPNQTATREAAERETKTAQKADSVSELLESIDSTQHPGVISSTKVLDRALMVLQIALNDHKVDGLAPKDISTILINKFRISTNSNAVNMALGRATTLVNRVPRGSGFIYRIMAPGEDYLAHLKEGRVESASHPTKKRIVGNVTKANTKKRNSLRNHSSDSDTTKLNVAVSKKPLPKKKGKVRLTSLLGPKAAIMELVDAGFFSTPQTGAEVQGHLKMKRGLTVGTDQLRLAMLRLVRDGVLDRNENKEGNYEYTKPKA